MLSFLDFCFLFFVTANRGVGRNKCSYERECDELVLLLSFLDFGFCDSKSWSTLGKRTTAKTFCIWRASRAGSRAPPSTLLCVYIYFSVFTFFFARVCVCVCHLCVRVSLCICLREGARERLCVCTWNFFLFMMWRVSRAGSRAPPSTLPCVYVCVCVCVYVCTCVCG